MKQTPQNIAERLAREGQKTRQFFARLEAAQWSEEVYADGQLWTVHHILAHFVETEASIPRLIRAILAGGPGVSEDFDIDRYNQSKVPAFSEWPQDELIDEFSRLRAETVALVEAMNPEDLAQEGRHPFLGVTQVGEMLKLMYLHLNLHIRDIKRVLRAKA